jgi:hypothetical protein
MSSRRSKNPRFTYEDTTPLADVMENIENVLRTLPVRPTKRATQKLEALPPTPSVTPSATSSVVFKVNSTKSASDKRVTVQFCHDAKIPHVVQKDEAVRISAKKLLQQSKVGFRVRWNICGNGINIRACSRLVGGHFTPNKWARWGRLPARPREANMVQ